MEKSDELIKKIKEDIFKEYMLMDEQKQEISNKLIELESSLRKVESRLKVVSIKDLYGKEFYIPLYQRGYRWKEKQVKRLLEDLLNFYNAYNTDELKKISYCLQPIIVKRKSNEPIEVIDGQQRLITIFLILKELINQNVYELKFETREDNLKQYLYQEQQEIQLKDMPTIDCYYINEAKKCIHKVFKDKQLKKSIKELIDSNRVKILWYEVNEDEISNEIFARVNDGKILLTDAELLKALLLKLDKGDEENENSMFEQYKKAYKWDKIENTLEDNEFWFFLVNKKENENYITRMDLIFKLLDTKNKRKNERIFEDFEEEISANGQGKKDIWDNMIQKYEVLQEWYNDLELYNLIGYIINEADVNYIKKIKDLMNSYLNIEPENNKKESNNIEPENNEKETNNIETKKEFKLKIKKMIREDLINTRVGELKLKKEQAEKKKIKQYEKEIQDLTINNRPINILDIEYNYDKEIKNEFIRKLLLLFNIVTVIDTQTRFSFYKYKMEEWDIEHVYPVHDGIEDDSEDKEGKAEQLRRSLISFLRGLKQTDIEILINNIIKEKKPEKYKNEKNTKIYKESSKKMQQLKSISKDIAFRKKLIRRLENSEIKTKEIKEISIKVNSKFSSVGPNNKDSIGNLVLLNSCINRSYQNDLFMQKRDVIIKKVIKLEDNEREEIKYILPCTQNVFVKFYSNQILQMDRWDELDCENYMQKIVEKINKSLDGQEVLCYEKKKNKIL